MDLLIASRNLHKIRECKAILKQIKGLDLFSLLDFPNYTPPEEVGTTFEANARLKAIHAAKALNMLSLSDDSGLVVPALNNEPGVRSARYAGELATDAENRFKLTRKISSLLEHERSARYECCMVLASPQEVLKVVEASCFGTILTEERGSQGFGYDPLFVKTEYNLTFAQLSEEMKNRLSHRRKALDKIMLTLEPMVSKYPHY